MELLIDAAACSWRAERQLRLPEFLLTSVSLGGGLSSLALLDAAARFVDLPLGSEQLTSQVRAALAWFERRRDVYRGPTGRYHAMPTHAVALPSGDEKTEVWVCLFGASNSDGQLREVTERLDGIFCSDLVAGDEGWRVGLERQMILPVRMEQEFMVACKSLGVTVLDMGVVRAALPTISDLEIPERSFFQLDAVPGAMQAYHPVAAVPYQAGRWAQVSDSRASLLLRTVPGDVQDRGQRRYYLQHAGRFGQIDRDAAILWQYRVDADARSPIPVYFDVATGKLWLNSPLPSDLFRWLRLISTAPVSRIGYSFVVQVGPYRDEVRKVLLSNLGVDWRIGIPPTSRATTPPGAVQSVP